jgi:hypothetical protein
MNISEFDFECQEISDPALRATGGKTGELSLTPYPTSIFEFPQRPGPIINVKEAAPLLSPVVDVDEITELDVSSRSALQQEVCTDDHDSFYKIPHKSPNAPYKL